MSLDASWLSDVRAKHQVLELVQHSIHYEKHSEMRHLKILLVEDDESFVAAVNRMVLALSFEHTITHVGRITSALTALSDQCFDIVLCDLTLPDATEQQCVEAIHAEFPDVPLVVLTSLESQAQAQCALKSGAQDSVCKDLITSQLLDRTIWHAIERQKIRTENGELIRELELQQHELNEKNTALQQVVTTAHRFVDNVSHEFRTPLTVIREYAALMGDGVLGEVSEQQSEFLDVIRYRVDDLNTMVDDMLDSSKLAAGIMGMDRVSSSVNSIVERPLAGLELKAQVRGVKLIFETSGELPAVFCDPEKAGRVVTNLVSNAIKFCEDGVGVVNVFARWNKSQQDIEISIVDNGPGIEPEELGVLFERFRQLGTGTQCSTKGFGLGLNIARELVDQNFGEIRIESKVGVGTTCRFTLPVDYWPEIVRRYAAHVMRDNSSTSVTVLQAKAVGETCSSTERDIESFWRFTDRQPDLVRRSTENEWTLLLVCEQEDIQEVIDGFQRNHARVNRNRTKPMATLEFSMRGCFLLPSELPTLFSEAENSIGIVDQPSLIHAGANLKNIGHVIPTPTFLRNRDTASDLNFPQHDPRLFN